MTRDKSRAPSQQCRLARDLGVSPRRINEIVHCKRSITADTALRLAACFGNSPSFWLGLQMNYDLDVAEDALSSRIKKEVHHIAVVYPAFLMNNS